MFKGGVSRSFSDCKSHKHPRALCPREIPVQSTCRRCPESALGIQGITTATSDLTEIRESIPRRRRNVAHAREARGGSPVRSSPLPAYRYLGDLVLRQGSVPWRLPSAPFCFPASFPFGTVNTPDETRKYADIQVTSPSRSSG